MYPISKRLSRHNFLWQVSVPYLLRINWQKPFVSSISFHMIVTNRDCMCGSYHHTTNQLRITPIAQFQCLIILQIVDRMRQNFSNEFFSPQSSADHMFEKSLYPDPGAIMTDTRLSLFSNNSQSFCTAILQCQHHLTCFQELFCIKLKKI